MRTALAFEPEPFELTTAPDRSRVPMEDTVAGEAGFEPRPFPRPLRAVSPGGLEEEFRLSDFPETILKALRGGLEGVAVRLAATWGYRDEDKLTNLIFFVRHPERGGRALTKGEPGFHTLSREWLDIRDRLVRPALQGGGSPSAASKVAPAIPSGPCRFGFVATAVESPGGGRITRKTPPAPGEVVKVQGVSRKISLHRLAAQAWEALVAAARADGVAHPLLLPTSGYRTLAEQQASWERALKKYGSPEAARQWVAPPGGSPHHSGRAVDLWLGLSNASENVAELRRTPAYQWLARHAACFGFYPYDAEPWHWEYNPPDAG